MRIIVDAFGGDNAPAAVIEGCVEAASEYGQEIVLVGRSDVINDVLDKNEWSRKNLYISDAPDIITMENEPTDILKNLKNCSMSVGLRLLADGQGDAFVSAGNTGALVVGSTFIVKRCKGVKRAAIATLLPTFGDGPMLLIDSGANVEVRPEMLMEFGVMGYVYMQKVMNVENPRVALLNVGAESTKGGSLQTGAYELLKKAGINFTGNIEGRDIPVGACDVAVADGFTGNVVLKTVEGVASAMVHELKDMFKSSAVSKLAAAMMLRQMKEFAKRFDYSEYGGAPLLGISRPVIKAHGSSDALAIKNAIRQAREFAESDAIDVIKNTLA